MSIKGAPVMAATVVAVDVGKNTAALSVTDVGRRRLLGPVDFAMTAPALTAMLERVCAVLPAASVTIGIEAAGHYHRPLLAAGVPDRRRPERHTCRGRRDHCRVLVCQPGHSRRR